MSWWIRACVTPTAKTSKPATSSRSPGPTAVTRPSCSPSFCRTPGGAHTRSPARSPRAAPSTCSSTWSKCSWVISTASARATPSRAAGVNTPGSMTIVLPSLASATQACAYLVSSTAPLYNLRLTAKVRGMPFAPGQVVLQRYVRRDRYTFVRPLRVVRDDEDGLLLWLTAGSEFAALVAADGKTSHDLPLDELNQPRLIKTPWRDYDVLEWLPPGAAYSIWWMF